jgi:integrase
LLHQNFTLNAKGGKKMSVLAECRFCGRKQSLRNKICKCGENLDKQKRAKQFKYSITYRLPGGKQVRESVGYSIKEAREADGKRKSQKRENRIWEMLPESKIKFSELAQWYLNLGSVKKLAAFDRYEDALNNFTSVFGKFRLNEIKQANLEDYQIERKENGAADGTIDLEIRIAQAMVTKAFDNDLIDGTCLKAFRKTKALLERGSNARKTLITFEQFERLLEHAAPYYRAVLIIAYNTGARLGEIKGLRWSYIDRE